MISNKEKILNLYPTGLTNRQIAETIGVHHATVGYWLRKEGLKPNGNGPTKIRKIGNDEAQCTKCDQVKSLSEYLLCRPNGPNSYYLSYCNRCRNNQINTSLRKSVDRFLSDRYQRLKRRCKETGIAFELDKEYFLSLFKEQNGKCFYTDKEINWNGINGHRADSLSLDKIVPNDGYIKGNVVFCLDRINTIKNNVTLDEMKEWMPNWYERAIKHIERNRIS